MKLKRDSKTINKQIVDWINSNPVINGSVVAAKAGIQPNNFGKMLRQERPIPGKYLKKIEAFIAKYGYNVQECDATKPS